MEEEDAKEVVVVEEVIKNSLSPRAVNPLRAAVASQRCLKAYDHEQLPEKRLLEPHGPEQITLSMDERHLELQGPEPIVMSVDESRVEPEGTEHMTIAPSAPPAVHLTWMAVSEDVLRIAI